MTAVVFGSPHAAAIREVDRQIEMLRPCTCGGAPMLSACHYPDSAGIWYCCECSNRHCRRKHSSTLLYDEIADALAEWRQFHPDAAEKK